MGHKATQLHVSSVVSAWTTYGDSLFHSGMVLGKKEHLKQSTAIGKLQQFHYINMVLHATCLLVEKIGS